MRLFITRIFAALAAAAAATGAAAPTEEPAWRDLLHSFQSAPIDFFHLGDDGVLQHFNESGTVLNYTTLSPQQISQALYTSSLNNVEEEEYLSQVFRNVDDRNVKGSALMNPPAYIYTTNFLNNRKLSETSEVPQSNLDLSPRQQCVPRHCVPSGSWQGDDWLNNDAENPPELPEGGDTPAPDPFLNVLWHSADNDMQASSKLA
ncbi:hypothetical protein AARAC_002339 [Aspergillus arachidicola]|uniref:Uncharacterized protein n=1 Tax=Aspergillus arachidicola TaxID=656916 RepID=A0A2G7FX21_9EURO|nr:hypothetical protein AARAC_002339 [Aspergillus arachidicola]